MIGKSKFAILDLEGEENHNADLSVKDGGPSAHQAKQAGGPKEASFARRKREKG